MALLGQRPGGRGGTLQPAPFLALGLQCGPARAPSSDTAATTNHRCEARAGMAGGTCLTRLDRLLRWWHAWDGDTAAGAERTSALGNGTGTGISRKRNLRLLAGGLPSLRCHLVRSPQRKWLSALAGTQAGQQRASVGDSPAVPDGSPSPLAPAPLCSSTPLAPGTSTSSRCSAVTPDTILKVLRF